MALPAAEPPRLGVLKSNVETFELEQLGPPVYAGFWRRFGAFVIDWICLVVLTLVAGFVVGIVSAVIAPGAEAADNLAGLLALAIGLLYYPLQESSPAQATFGKRAFNLVVTDAQRKRLSFWRALARYLAKIVSGMTLGIGYLMAGFTERKQALHDMLADTLVLQGS